MEALVGYADSGLAILLSLVLLVVSLAVVRPVNATAGYLGGAAGGVRLLLTCCGTGVSVAMRTSYEMAEVLGYVATALAVLENLAFWGLVTAAGVTLARGAQAAGGAR